MITKPQVEMLDIVDENDNVIGKATREECHRKKLRHRTVNAFVFDKDWSIFIIQRSENVDTEPLFWTITSGGHVESGHTYEDTIRKELKEELDLKDKPVFIKMLRNDVDHELENSAQYYVMANKKPKINKGEIKQGKFVDFQELNRLMKKEKFSQSDAKYIHGMLVDLLKQKKII